MKHVKLYEDFIVSLSSERIIENKGTMKVYEAGNFLFDNKNAAQKYIDLLKKLTFEYNTGNSRLYSRGPIDDAFNVEELTINADSIQEGLDSARVDENYYRDLQKRIANTPSPVPADILAEAENILAPFIKHFSVEADFKFAGTNSKAPSLRLALYENYPNSDYREYAMPGRFLNEKDAKQALNFAMKNAIAYPLDKDPFGQTHFSLDKLSPRTSRSKFEMLDHEQLLDLAKSSRSKSVIDAVEEFISFRKSLEGWR